MSCDIAFDRLCYHDVKDVIEQANPEFSAVLSQHQFLESMELFRLRYPYGAHIFKKGALQLPLMQGGTIALKDLAQNHPLKSKLEYSYLPLGLIINRQCEVFTQSSEQVLPLCLLSCGNLIGLYETLNYLSNFDSQPSWSMTSGARMAFMLPRISDNRAHTRLRKQYNISETMPMNLSEHWRIFSHLGQKYHQEANWYTEVIFFSSDWFKSHNNKDFSHYLYQLGWQKSYNTREQLNHFFNWKRLYNIIQEKNIHPKLEIPDYLRQLFLIAHLATPAYTIAQNNMAIPKDWIQDLYINHYGLKEYLPSIMHSASFAPSKDKPAYYSLGFAASQKPQSHRYQRNTVSNDLLEVKNIIQMLKQHYQETQAPELRFLKDKNFSFFHSDASDYDDILSIETLKTLDPSFMFDSTRFPNRTLYTRSTFFRGCIQVS